MLNESASPPDPMSYVGLWLLSTRFCADTVPTMPGASSASIEMSSSTTYQLPRFCSKLEAEVNMLSMLATFETSQPEMSPLKTEAVSNMPCMSVTLETSQPEMSPLKTEAVSNMPCMSVTLETSQPEMSPLKI